MSWGSDALSAKPRDDSDLRGGLPDGPVAHLPGGIDTIYKYLYTSLVSEKSIFWVGSSLDDVGECHRFGTATIETVGWGTRKSTRPGIKEGA